MASPDPKRQQQSQQQQVPPEYKPFEEESKKKRQDFNWSNRQHVEDWLNGLKPGFENYLREKHKEAIYSNLAFTQHLYSYLTLYQGEIVGEYLSEGAMEMMFSALGPIGNLWRSAYHKNISWKMAWMMNPVNPNAVYYYLQSLPQRKAFEIAMLPIKGAMAIMAKGGGPFTETTYTDFNGKVKKEYLFTPLVQATKVAHSLADGLDKLSGFSTNTFDHTSPQEKKTWNEDNSKWKQDINQVNQGLKTALENLAAAKKSGNKQGVSGAYKDIDKFLKKYNGSIFRKSLGNTARRLRSTERDPISYILSLLGGAIWDFLSFFTLNLAKTIAGKALNLIPGVKVLNAQITKFITSDKFLTNTAVGGSSLRSIIQGTFSPATASFGYTGYRGFSSLFPNASVNQLMNPFTGEILAFTVNPAGLIGGAATLSAGIFYNVALKMAATTNYYWTSQYQSYLKASTFKGGWALDEGALGNKLIKENYYNGFKPGPISNFAKFLAEHPFARIPINGLAVGDLVSPLMQQYYGWNPWVTRGVFSGADYLLQTRRAWGRLISENIIKPVWRVWTQPTWKIFGRTFITPHFRVFSLNNPNSFGSWAYEKYLNVFYKDPFNFRVAAMTERPWFKFYNKNVSGFAKNFFNPGFFMGFGLIPLLSQSIGAWAYVVGPVAGGVAWNLGARALTSIFPKIYYSVPAGMARINAVGWTGYVIGSLLDIVIPGTQAWLGPVMAGGFVAADIFLTLAGKSLMGLVTSGISSIVTAFSGVAAGAAASAAFMAAWATVMAIGSITLLTVFFAYTIYAGFWVPMIEEAKASQQSSNFSINNQCAKTPAGLYQCCSNFSITENVFNFMRYLKLKTSIKGTLLEVDLSNPDSKTDAWRATTPLQYFDTAYPDSELTSRQYTIYTDPRFYPPIVEGSLNYLFEFYLSTPSDQTQNLFELMSTNQSVVYSMKPFWDMLVALAKEHDGNKHLVAEYDAQIDLIEEQKNLVNDLINDIKSKDLGTAWNTANSYLDNEPMGKDPCPAGSDCPEEKQGLKQLYDSWKPTVQRYISKIEMYQGQTNPPLDKFLTDLETEFETLDGQIKILEQIRDLAKDAQGKMDDDDAARILELEEQNKFNQYTNLPPEEQEEIWNLLSKYFSDIFTNNGFFFVPRGTSYRACVDMNYVGPMPANPQTVCSTISYTPSFWSPATSFAKACTTFTPE